MVTIHFRDNAEMKLRDEICEGLVGSPAFINSDIAVCDDETAEGFYLVLGGDNGRNLLISIEGDVDLDEPSEVEIIFERSNKS